MVYIKNTQRKIKINLKTLKANAEKMLTFLDYKDFDLSIWFTTNATIQKFDKTYRKKDKPTDILSFPYHENLKAGQKIKPQSPEDKNLGDIIISLEFAKKDAHKLKQTLNQRLKILIAHGIAHLLGYTHETNANYSKMKIIEKRLLKAL